MQKEEVVQNWILKAERDIQTAKDLYLSNHFDWALFIWHLAIEKILKAKIISLNKKPPYIHDLTRLIKETDLPLDNNLISQLNEITSYNIEARYDDIKHAFYIKATKEYAEKWVQITQKIYNFIRKTI